MSLSSRSRQFSFLFFNSVASSWMLDIITNKEEVLIKVQITATKTQYSEKSVVAGFSQFFLVGAFSFKGKIPDYYSDSFLPDHRHHTERSTFYRNY